MTGAGHGWNLGGRIAPPRFLLFAAAFAIGVAAGVPTFGPGRGTMIAFDVAALLFFAALAPLLGDVTVADMRRTARRNDANRTMLLAFTFVTSAVILVAVAHEVAGRDDAAATLLVLTTLVIAWLFSNVVYALHYAHLFYLPDSAGGDARGLDFPSCAEPGYWDFLYFSMTLGMTFQTSDVAITNRRLRRVVTGHALAAFVFNLGVIAFTINVLGGGR